ncbi:MAG: thioredoxin family protein [bacterium]|nr:thioredoxin family protein [bacterium]
MKEIKVLGSGCANCKTTSQMIQAAAEKSGVEIHLEKVEDMAQIVQYGILSTPGVVVDGKVVHSGGLPSKEAIASWLQS